MGKEQEILKDPVIRGFLQTHEGAAEDITRAAKELADRDDAIPALRKLLPALSKGKLPIFFSYKGKDEAAAVRIVNLLRKWSARKLRITYQADFTEQIVGKEWRKWIHDSIDKANWFILLLPDPSDDWDWCLFETGLFEAKQLSGDRLICIHHPKTDVPDQITVYQAVAAEPERVKAFLKMLYTEPNAIPGFPAINDALEPRDIANIAQEIVDAILPPRKGRFHQIFEPWVAIRTDRACEFKSKDDLDSAIVEDANDEALRLFDFGVPPQTWGELWSGLPKGTAGEDNGWREELFHVIRRIASGRRFDPIQTVFQTKFGKMYRPVVHGIDRFGDRVGPIEKYHITFTEDVRAVDRSGMPGNLYDFATVMRFAFRFRWEILERFTKEPLTEDDVERVKSAFERTETDWKSSARQMKDADLTRLFPQGASRDAFVKLLRESALIRNPERTGKLDVAIEQKDGKKIQEILKQIIPLNQEFLEMATDAFSKKIHEA
jgi:hypothetical protein